jgi:hypothetical protein
MNGTKLFWIVPVVFFSAAAWAQADLKACGMSQPTLDKRISNCRARNWCTARDRMKLVTVDDGGRAVKMDAFGVLWGDRLVRGNKQEFTFEEAQTACRDATEADGYPGIPGIGEWRLPTAEEWARIGNDTQEYFRPDIHGDWSYMALADWHMFYWSGSPADDERVWAFIGYDDSDVFEDGWPMGSVVQTDRGDGTYRFALCVAKVEALGTN